MSVGCAYAKGSPILTSVRTGQHNTMTLTTLALMMVTAILANDTARTYMLRVLGWLAGETSPETLAIADIEPQDVETVYQDGVYEVILAGESARTITWFNGSQVSNLLAYGHSVAYVVSL